jgi:hypothetical protein
MRVMQHPKQGCDMSWVPSCCEVHERQYCPQEMCPQEDTKTLDNQNIRNNSDFRIVVYNDI